MFKRVVLVLFCLCSAVGLAGRSDDVVRSARGLIEREDLAVYRGWLKYLIFDVEVVSLRPDVDAAGAEAKRERLRDWVARIEADADAIFKLRGVQEWAYESAADGSGQPFMINIPQDYDEERGFPASLYMHGSTGNHAEHYSGDPNLRGLIELSVLGRSRSGGYVGLSGADVIGVLDYAESVWAIDADRVHLRGGSMGGAGTFRMGGLYPHRWASARPTCGFAMDRPYGNLVTLPIYAIHSKDDPVVPFIGGLGFLDRLRELGGQVVFDWTDGLGHGAWNYAEGNQRSNLWFREQVRPDSRSVTMLDYTALDGGAMRSWWAEIEEWGAEARPAHFVLKAAANNMLYATLENIGQLKLRVGESPFDASRPLKVSVNGRPLVEWASPLPDVVYLRSGDGEWFLDDEADGFEGRRHTPGGSNQLYNGEPLLIVYGTVGTAEENAVLREAAEVASRSSSALWRAANGQAGADGVEHTNNLYGALAMRADVELTDEDVERSHLVLIGTAAQNAAVAAIAGELPVSLADSEIRFADGESYAAEGLGLGLVYFNPRAPERLIFWVASEDARGYGAGSPVPTYFASQSGSNWEAMPGFDCLVASVEDGALVVTRRFASDWSLVSRTGEESRIEAGFEDMAAFSEKVAEAVRVELSSDFGLVASYAGPDFRVFRKGETRVDDLAVRYFYEPLGVVTMTGAELLVMEAKLKAKGKGLVPEVDAGRIVVERDYTIALNELSAFGMVRESGVTPTRIRLTDIQLRDVLVKMLEGL